MPRREPLDLIRIGQRHPISGVEHLQDVAGDAVTKEIAVLATPNMRDEATKSLEATP